MSDSTAPINPETDAWLAARESERMSGDYPEASEWSDDEENAREVLTVLLADLHAGANCSLHDLLTYLRAVQTAAARLASIIPAEWQTAQPEWWTGQNDRVTFAFGDGCDYDTVTSVFAAIVGWSVTVSTTTGDVELGEVVNVCEEGEDCPPAHLTGYLYVDGAERGEYVRIPWPTIVQITIW